MTKPRTVLILGSGPLRNDVIAIVAGLALYAVFFRWGHAALIGIPLVR